MEDLVHPANGDNFLRLVHHLKADTIPLWGKMKPQQMIEHLVGALEYSNGKKVTSCSKSIKETDEAKAIMIYSNYQIPKNLAFETLPLQYRYGNVNVAIIALSSELNDFEDYFKVPEITSVHPAFGPMNYEEWLIWHGKHFKHHLKQFSLLPGSEIPAR